MDPQERAFLDAIIDEPDDDTHRLVFANWLDDIGNSPRAEFIRLQIEYARLPQHSPRAWQLGIRANDEPRRAGRPLSGERLP